METIAQNTYEKISSIVLIILFVLLPLFFLPFTTVSFFYAKFGLATFCVLLAAILVIIKVINTRKITRIGWLYTGALAAVPVAYLISSFFSPNLSLSLMGQGVDSDTFYFVALGMLLTGLVTVTSIRKKQSVFISSLVFVGIALIVCLFHVIRYVFGINTLSFGLFQTISSNTIGSLGDLGVYAGLALIISLISLEFLPLQRMLRIGFYVALVVSLVVTCVSNFDLVTNIWGLSMSIVLTTLLALCSLVVFVHKRVASAKNAFPVISLIVFLVAFIFTIESGPISGFIAPHIGLTQNETLDVRVSPSGTASVAEKVLTAGPKAALLGTGPNRFFVAWGFYKPIDPSNSVNATPYWNSDFNLAFGFVPTSIVTSGIVGGLAWIFFFAVLIYYLYRLLKSVLKAEKDPLAAYSSLIVSVAVIYLWLAAILYTSGPVILFLAFFFTGLFGARLISEGIISTKTITWEEAGYWKSFGIVFGLVIALAGLVFVGYMWSTRAIAASYAEKAVITVQTGASVTPPAGQAPDLSFIAASQNLMAKAINLYQSGDYLRFYADVSLIRPSQLISSSTTAIQPEDVSQDVATDINRAALAATQAALSTDPTDYKNWIELGKVYETATFLGATTTAERARQSYATAESLNPTNPLPAFLLGRLYGYAHDYTDAKTQLNHALALKPDYTDAQTLLQQISTLGPGINAPAATTSTASTTSATSTKAQATKSATSTATSTVKK